MDLIDFEFTKKKYIKKVYSLYLQGKSEQDICLITNIERKYISNIIDCCNYLYI